MLLGALLAGVSLFLELWALYQGYPYHHDYAFFWSWLPEYALAGAVLGLIISGLIKPLISERKLLRQQGLHLAAGIISGSIWLVVALNWLPDAGVASPVIRHLGAFAAGLLSYAALRRYAQSRFAWVLSGFTTPWFCMLTLSVVLAVGIAQGKFGTDSWRTPEGWPQSALTDEPPRQPNVVLVVLDGVGAKHLGSYGYHRSTSPELDRIAGEGVVFDRAFAAAPWTLPSHASLFTGLQQSSHGAGWEHPHLADGHRRTAGFADAYTLAEALRARGFQTCGVSADPHLNAEHGMSQGFDYYFDLHATSIPDRLFVSDLLHRLGMSPHRHDWASNSKHAVATALSWLKQPRFRDPQQPFFLFLHLDEAAAPYRLPPSFEDAGRFLPPGANLESLTPAYYGDDEPRHLYHQGKRPLEPDEARIQTALYDASILYLDRQILALLEGMREQSLLEDTLLVFTSSHGEEFNEQNRFGHQFTLSDRVLHVPLIMRMPRLLPAGRRVQDLVSLVDVAPTVFGVLNQAETHPPSNGELLWEGFDYGPLLRGDGEPPRDWVLAQYQNPARLLLQKWSGLTPEQTRRARSITALRSDQSKYFRFGDGTATYLDLSKDPDEDAAERPAIEMQMGPTAQQYELKLQRLLNWLKTRRTILTGMQTADATARATKLAADSADKLLVPSTLFAEEQD